MQLSPATEKIGAVNFVSRKKYFSDARGQNDPPLGSTRDKSPMKLLEIW